MLSLTGSTKIRVIDDTLVSTVLTPVSEITSAYVYDWYGNKHFLSVQEAEPEDMFLIAAMSGEPQYVGGNHTLLAREKGKAVYKRYSVTDLVAANLPMFVHLPQRKITLDDDGPFFALAADEKSVHLAASEATDLIKLMTTAATAGISVHRARNELRIDLEKSRPVCFATKLINGNFQANLSGTLEELCASAIVNPYGPFNDQLIEKTDKTGVIFEGSSLFNDVLALPPRPVAKKAPVYHIKVEDDAPVELAWFCT